MSTADHPTPTPTPNNQHSMTTTTIPSAVLSALSAIAWEVYWSAADGQSDMLAGCGATPEDARADAEHELFEGPMSEVDPATGLTCAESGSLGTPRISRGSVKDLLAAIEEYGVDCDIDDREEIRDCNGQDELMSVIAAILSRN